MSPAQQHKVSFCWSGWILFNLGLVLSKLETSMERKVLCLHQVWWNFVFCVLQLLADNPAWYCRHQIGQIERLPSWEEWSLLPREAQSFSGSWLIHVASFHTGFLMPSSWACTAASVAASLHLWGYFSKIYRLFSLQLSLLNSCMTSALVLDLSGASKCVTKLLGHGAVSDKSRNSTVVQNVFP